MQQQDNTTSSDGKEAAVNFFFAGGGTGGHIYPAVAVAEQLKILRPGAEIDFICSTRHIDSHILGQTEFNYQSLPASGFSLRPLRLIKFVINFIKSKSLAHKILSRDPSRSVLISVGGFVSGPAIMAARKLHIPIAMINVDFVPGKANKHLARYAKEIYVQFPETARYFGMSRKKVTVTGCPLRKDFENGDRCRAIENLGLNKQKKTILIVGGSSGAQSLNNAIALLLPGLEPFASSWQIVHITGRSNYHRVKAAYSSARIDFKLVDYYHNMGDLYSAADLLIGRGGAVAVAEYTAAGVPVICLPYPYHADNHQYLNTKPLADTGAAIIVDDIPTDCVETTKQITEHILDLMKDEDKRKEMSEASKQLAMPRAAEHIAENIVELIS